MGTRRALRETKLQKKFEVSTAHISKCFEVISDVFSDIYNGIQASEKRLKVIEKLERSAKFFRNERKNERFYKLPSFFYFIRSKLHEVKTLDMDFKAFEKVCREHWNTLTSLEKRRLSQSAERLKRLRQSINGFSLFSDPENAEKSNLK